MSVHKNENNTVQVEFTGDVTGVTLALTQESGETLAALVIAPMLEAVDMLEGKEIEKKFEDFDVRFIFVDTHDIDYMIQSLENAKDILLSNIKGEDLDETIGEAVKETTEEEVTTNGN